MLILKPGVELTGLRPEMLLGIAIVCSIYQEENLGDCTITSVMDGRHSSKSLHYAGQAADFRTRHLLPRQRERLHQLAAQNLTSKQFDVILEPDHLHVEFQPSRP